jgi:hypothetical protein
MTMTDPKTRNELVAFLREVERFFHANGRLGELASAVAHADPLDAEAAALSEAMIDVGQRASTAMLAIIRLALGEEGLTYLLAHASPPPAEAGTEPAPPHLH